jgi:hypothetical protein
MNRAGGTLHAILYRQQIRANGPATSSSAHNPVHTRITTSVGRPGDPRGNRRRSLRICAPRLSKRTDRRWWHTELLPAGQGGSNLTAALKFQKSADSTIILLVWRQQILNSDKFNRSENCKDRLATQNNCTISRQTAASRGFWLLHVTRTPLLVTFLKFRNKQSARFALP